jgi:hypothetical protein
MKRFNKSSACERRDWLRSVGQDRGQRSNHKALKGKQPDAKDVLADELLPSLESPGFLDRFSFCTWSRETISQPPGQCDRSLLKGTVPARFDKAQRACSQELARAWRSVPWCKDHRDCDPGDATDFLAEQGIWLNAWRLSSWPLTTLCAGQLTTAALSGSLGP